MVKCYLSDYPCATDLDRYYLDTHKSQIMHTQKIVRIIYTKCTNVYIFFSLTVIDIYIGDPVKKLAVSLLNLEITSLQNYRKIIVLYLRNRIVFPQ